jgi:hypothetical protein
LLHHRIRELEPDSSVYRIEGWRSPGNFEGKLDSITGNFFRPKRATYLLFDDAEDTYRDSGLWNDFFKMITVIAHYRVVLFCSHSSPSSRVFDFNSEYRVPNNRIAPNQRIALWPTPSSALGVLLTKAEYNDLLSRQNSPICLSQDLHDFIFHWTGGHVGAIVFLLDSIKAKVSGTNILVVLSHF